MFFKQKLVLLNLNPIENYSNHLPLRPWFQCVFNTQSFINFLNTMAKYRVWRSIVSSEMKISFAHEFRFELISNPNEYPIKNRTESQEKKLFLHLLQGWVELCFCFMNIRLVFSQACRMLKEFSSNHIVVCGFQQLTQAQL